MHKAARAGGWLLIFCAIARAAACEICVPLPSLTRILLRADCAADCGALYERKRRPTDNRAVRPSLSHPQSDAVVCHE